ncbi:MAG TPA: TonB family protein, partial [Methylomirabilota bacterium]|nr:TonB family protein [Methylomirabilota bacterium]
MSRFERKCFIGSAALHGLLLVTFLVSSAFLDSQPPVSAASVITILPLDTKPYGKPDGNPEPPAPAPQSLPPEPRPEPPKPVEPEVKPEPVKVPEVKKPEPVVKNSPVKPIQKKAPTRAEPAISKTMVRRTNELVRLEQARIAQAKEAADRKYREDLAKWKAQRGQAIAAATAAVGGVGKSLSKSTIVTSLGVDTSGGSVSGSYGERLKAIYDARWTLNNDLSDDESVASVSVVIARDGSVRSARITRQSGNKAFDRSVERVLENVRNVPAFPPEMKDAEREFTWR